MIRAAALFAALAGLPAAFPAAAPMHDISVRIDPQSRALEGRDRITLDAPRAATLLLSPRFKVNSLTADGRRLDIRPADAHGLQRIALPAARRIELRWSGELEPLDQRLEHRDTLTYGAPASGPQGTFLPAGSGWYPAVEGELERYRVALDLPAGQRGLVPGRLLDEREVRGRYRARFEFANPAEGISLMAGPYRVDERRVRTAAGSEVRLRTYFHPEIADLAGGYLDSVAGYLDLYEGRIGAYPFSEFSIVSSPTPTGFGMPTLTYLGVEVLRLPFIRATSLGHEVLHNWWGNGVYPDYASGNWSEGLTTFMADYHYAERAGADKARAMRQGWLRDLSGIPPGADQPLAAFTSRTHGLDQAVGYGKAAMMFVMLRDRIGEPAFDRAIRRFWQTQRFRIADWDDLRVAFEAASGQLLEPFFTQWLDRTGLAEIALSGGRDAGDGVGVTLAQNVPPYVLEVPLRIDPRAGPTLRRVRLEQARQDFEIELDPGDSATRVTLDPDSLILRRLHRRETPPTLRELQFDRRTELLTLGDDAFTSAARTLAARLLDHAAAPHAADVAPGPDPLLVIGDEARIGHWLARHDLPLAPPEVAHRGTVRAWTLRLPSGTPLGIVAADSTQALANATRPLPHYRQQSWLVLQDARTIARGVWPAEPLSVPVTRH